MSDGIPLTFDELNMRWANLRVGFMRAKTDEERHQIIFAAKEFLKEVERRALEKPTETTLLQLNQTIKETQKFREVIN